MRGLLLRKIPCELNVDEILRPADAFCHPQQVVCDPDLAINEKRAILASWASDACAVETMPGFRRSPKGETVTFDDIMDALKDLDAQARQGLKKSPRYRRWLPNVSHHVDLLDRVSPEQPEHHQNTTGKKQTSLGERRCQRTPR